MATEPGGPNSFFLWPGLRAGIAAGFWLADLLWAWLQICCARFFGLQIGLQFFFATLAADFFCEIGCDVFANFSADGVGIFFFCIFFCEFVVDCLWTVNCLFFLVVFYTESY